MGSSLSLLPSVRAAAGRPRSSCPRRGRRRRAPSWSIAPPRLFSAVTACSRAPASSPARESCSEPPKTRLKRSCLSSFSRLLRYLVSLSTWWWHEWHETERAKLNWPHSPHSQSIWLLMVRARFESISVSSISLIFFGSDFPCFFSRFSKSSICSSALIGFATAASSGARAARRRPPAPARRHERRAARRAARRRRRRQRAAHAPVQPRRRRGGRGAARSARGAACAAPSGTAAGTAGSTSARRRAAA